MNAPAANARHPSARQIARAEAQRLADSESSPGEGARAAGLLAAADHYDELAIWLLDRLPARADDEVVACTRQCLDWRRGQRGFDRVGDLHRLAPASIRQLLIEAFRCALPDEARRLWSIGSPGEVAGGGEFDPAAVADVLAQLGRAPEDGPARALVVVAGLPDGALPKAGLPETAVDPGDAGAAPGAAGPARWWAGLRRRAAAMFGSPGESPPVHRTQLAEGFLPSLHADSVIVVPGGRLDRFTARHWVAVLGQGHPVIVMGLVAHDPGALSPALVDALRRQAPVGVADTTSQLLLAEWGVPAVVEPATGPARGQPTLWTHAPSLVAAPWWVGLWQPRAAVPCLDPQAVLASRRQWLAAQTPPAPVHWQPPPARAAVVDATALGSKVLTRQALPAPPIELALTVDANQARWVPVVIDSALNHASRPLRVHLVTRQVGVAERDDWVRLFDGRAELVWHPFDEVRYPEGVHLLSHTTVSTLDRLMLPSLLRETPRVIYLDVDLVVTGDLAELWRLDLQGRPLAAKPSTSPGTRWGLQMLYQALSVLPLEQALRIRAWLHAAGPMGFRAFNAGVLVMDLARLRDLQLPDRCLSMVEHAAMNDQDALNACIRDQYLPLDTVWNAAPRQDVTEGAKIVHFVGPIKPWHDTYISRKRDFEQVCEQLSRRRFGAAHA